MQEFICPNGRMSVNGVCPIFEGDDGQIKDIIKTSTDKTLSDRLAIKAPTTDFNTTKPQINISSKIPKTDFNITKPEINTSSKITDMDNRLNYIENINKKILPEQDEKLKELKKEREKSGFFKFDFEKETPSAKKSAGNIISDNIEVYNSFVEEKLGISSKAQNIFRVGAALTASSPIGAIAPFAIPFLGGMALNNAENTRIQNITNQDTQGDITTIDPTTVQKRMQIMSIQPTNQDIYRGGGPGRDTSPSGPTAQAGGFASDGGPVSNQTGRGRVGF